MSDRVVVLFEDDEPIPPTTRAPARDLARLIAESVPPPERGETADALATATIPCPPPDPYEEIDLGWA